MQAYPVKVKPIVGTSFREVHKKALRLYQEIKKQTKRTPHIRSAYFKNEKIFLTLFWSHLYEKKNFADLVRRLKWYPCAIELVKKSKIQPISKDNPNKRSEKQHRFFGKTSSGDYFCVQIKEEKKTGRKWLMSSFPIDKKRLSASCGL
ncbi:hypothetical protein IPJ72_06960 [Candidatus Peregrinibacteria bacterium]|nr:MAG: hypothetical protein IPJ72_06960 [Candidatus Peregrinibacteria bacterium]